jgi:hypothetical protein
MIASVAVDYHVTQVVDGTKGTGTCRVARFRWQRDRPHPGPGPRGHRRPRTVRPVPVILGLELVSRSRLIGRKVGAADPMRTRTKTRSGEWRRGWRRGVPARQQDGPRRDRVEATRGGNPLKPRTPGARRCASAFASCGHALASGLRRLTGLKRISGLATRLLAICCISATDWFPASPSGSTACASTADARSRQHAGAALAATRPRHDPGARS